MVGGSKWAAKVTSYNQLLLAIPRYLIELLLVSFVVLLVLFKVLSEENVMSIIPTLSMFGVAAIRLLPSSSTFSSGMAQLRYGRDGVSRLYKDLKEWEFDNLFVEGRNKKIEGGNGRSFESLVLSDVKFKYRSSDSYILRGVSFEIFAGESIGLIGGSGAGKTTLVDIVLGLLDPVEGRIVYNNENIHDVGGGWRSQVAYLPQQVFIIDDTIMRNVALGVDDSEIDYDRLARALERARLTDFVEGLLDGYDTVLGERGVKMSGGQRQRIALARAFYHERNVLVLDESTSALDVETEAEVIDEIRMLHGKVTMIIIAHRHSMLKNCDRIYKLEEGEVVELSLDSYG